MSALEGMYVLDLTMLLPGPFCTLMMADFGAEVIKVEPPLQGDYIRWFPPMIGKMSARHHLVNRNKKSITLDLKSEKGKEIFLKLVKKADILVEGFRPGVMERLGLHYDRVNEINPGIIYCSISGYGQDGPYKSLVGHDINYIGLAGLLDISGRKGDAPAVPGVLTADIGGGLMALIGILLACQARVKTGRGQYIDISMLDGSIAWLYHIAGDYFATDKCPTRGDSFVTGYYACYTVYPTRDGKYVTVGALEEKFWHNFCRFLNREDLIPYQFIPEKQEELKKNLTEIFLEKTRDEWVDAFSPIDVCFGPVKDLEEAFKDPQVVYRRMIQDVEVPEIGLIKQLGIPIKLSQTPGNIKRSAPELGEDTEPILKDLGYSLSEIKNLEQLKII
jgi:crotonobetainyl-CoA:carnitine CoA-transferase CaiB-like acyl-CoA transferase